jgi:beta-galactosidase
MMENYGVRWEGKLLPTTTGEYTFALESSGAVRLWIDGQQLIDDSGRTNNINRARLALEAGKPVALRVEFWHRKGNAQCKLLWAPPEADAPDAAGLIERVKRDGTTLFILDRADTWMKLIETNTAVKYSGSFKIGTTWLGGLHFVREHPLFKDLPVNTAMDWPYQAVVRNGRARTGLRLEGEELVAGAWHSYPMDLGTAVGVIPCGKGKIVVSTLDIASQLNSSDTSAIVARKLLCNFIAFGNPAR